MNSAKQAEVSSGSFQPQEGKVSLQIIGRSRRLSVGSTYHSPGGMVQRIGILTSLVIHAGVLFFIVVVMSPAPIIPGSKTLYIRFAESPYISTGEQNRVNRESRPLSLSADKARKQERVRQDRPQLPAEMNSFTAAQPAVAMNREMPLPVVQLDEQSSSSTVIALGPATGAATGSTAAKGMGEVVAQRVFGEAEAPAFIRREIPVYPLMARRLGKEGKVVLKLRIDAKGNLQHIEVIEPSGFGFTEAAVAAVQKSIFSPAYHRGSPAASEAVLSVRFVLE